MNNGFCSYCGHKNWYDVRCKECGGGGRTVPKCRYCSRKDCGHAAS